MRRRLVLAIAGVAGAAVVLFAVPLGLVLAHAYRDRELLRLQRDTIAATRAIDLGPRRNDRVELPPSTDALTVYDGAGRRRTGAGPAQAPPVVRRALRSGRPADATAGDALRDAVPLLAGERVAGALLASRSDARAAQDAREAWLVIAGLAAAVVLLAVGAALLLGRRLSAPLERLAVAARRLGHGDFTAAATPAAIPEVDAVAGALGATARRLDALVTRERAFSADASHQLRTPLAALKLELEGLALRAGDEPELHAALGQIERLERTVTTLLQAARDAPRPTRAAPLDTLLDELEAEHRGRLAGTGRAFELRVSERPLLTAASPDVVRQVLEVLLDNAEAHGNGAVRVSASSRGPVVSLDVSDEGPGFSIDPERAFRRRESAGDGHGIGLSLARALAEAEGGRLTVADPGPRPRVRLVVPAAPASGT